MSLPPTDDDIRGMLEARSAAVSPGADREVLAAVRGAIAGPGANEGAAVSFGVRRVETVGRTSRMPWIAGAAAAAAIVAVAVFGGRLPLARPGATTGPAGSPAPVAGVAANSAVPTVGGAPRSLLPDDASGGIAGAATLTIEQLGNRLRTGELDGKTVIVTAPASLAPGRCRYEASPDPTHDCIFMHLDGLPDEFISKGERTAAQVQAEIDAYGPTTPLVLVGVDGGLQLAGWLVAGADAALPPDGPALLRRGLQDDGLVAVSGWLHADGVEQITDTPEPNAASGLIVDIDPSVETPTAAPVAGTFLLRPDVTSNRLSDVVRWHVIATLSSSSTVYVAKPSASLPASTISASAVIAALADGSLDGQVLAIDGNLETVAWECPLDARPCERFYVQGLPGVAITWRGLSLGSDGSSGAVGSATAGRLLVTPRRGPLDMKHGYLELLGILEDTPDRPKSVADLDQLWSTQRIRDPLLVDAVNGWLVVDGPVDCPELAPGASPCPQQRSLLATSEPDASGALSTDLPVPVRVLSGAVGIGAPPIRSAGPFLVRWFSVSTPCDGVSKDASPCASPEAYGWMVVARADPGTVRLVTIH